MALTQKMHNILLLQDNALKKGCVRTELLLAKELRVDDRVRLKCRLNTCEQYGANLMCPPHVPDLAETSQILEKYTFALVMQITEPLSGSDYIEPFHKIKNNFGQIIVELEKEAFRMGFTLTTGLSGGHCTLCETCARKEGKFTCRHPQQARPSMEALGMDVGEVCRRLGLPADFIPGEVTLTGLLLID